MFGSVKIYLTSMAALVKIFWGWVDVPVWLVLYAQYSIVRAFKIMLSCGIGSDTTTPHHLLFFKDYFRHKFIFNIVLYWEKETVKYCQWCQWKYYTTAKTDSEKFHNILSISSPINKESVLQYKANLEPAYRSTVQVNNRICVAVQSPFSNRLIDCNGIIILTSLCPCSQYINKNCL